MVKEVFKSYGIVAFLLFFLVVFTSSLAFAIPQTFNIHGKLTDSGGSALEGTYDMNFSIYAAPSGGSALWSNLNQAVSTDTNGIYNVILTAIDLSFADQYYLGIQVEGDDEMTPRINLTSSPYAMRAQNVSVSGVEFSSNVDMGAVNITTTGTGFFGFLGSLSSRITKLWVQDVNASGNVFVAGNVSGDYFIGDGSQLTNINASATNYWTKTGTNLSYSGGGVKINADNNKLFFGAGDDASIYYDGTNLNINPKEVGSGQLNITGVLESENIYAWGNDVQIGELAGGLNTGASQTAIGYKAGYQNNATSQLAFGFYAGQGNTGHYELALGQQAGQLNTGNYQTALGYKAGSPNSGTEQIAIGHQAGASNTAIGQVAIGYNAGQAQSGTYQTTMGYASGKANTGDHEVSIGYYAGYYNEGDRLTSIGYQAGRINTGNDVIAIGYRAGYNNTGSNNVFIGDASGYENVESNQFILKQNRINTIPLIQGNFSSGLVEIQSLNVTGISYLGSLIINADNITTNRVISRDGNITFHNSIGGEIFRMDDDGNVGIGTTSPDEKLEVDGNIFLTSDNDKIYIGAGKDASIYYDGVDLNINPKEVGAGQVIISGKLQINLPTSTAGLSDVNIQEAASNTILTVASYSDNPTHKPIITFKKSHNDTLGEDTTTVSGETLGQFSFNGILTGGGGRTGTMLVATQDGAATGSYLPARLGIWTDYSDGRLERFTVKADGKVGIGTTSPTHELNVVGNANITGNVYGTFIGDGSSLTSVPTYNATYAAWNKTYADTLYAGIEWDYNQSTATYNMYNTAWSSTYNATYAGITGDAADWNKTYADTLYAGIEWDYNQSTATYNMYNTAWSTTYNSTYHAKPSGGGEGANYLTFWSGTNTLSSSTQITITDSTGGVQADYLRATTGVYAPNICYSNGTGCNATSGNYWTLSNGNISYSGGNVGIGTANPAYTLDIQGGASDKVFRLLDSGNVDMFRVTGTSDNADIQIEFGDLWAYNSELIFRLNETTDSFSFTGGNVGIGTTTPSALFEVSNSTQSLLFSPDGGDGNSPMINTTANTNLTITSMGGSVIVKLG